MKGYFRAASLSFFLSFSLSSQLPMQKKQRRDFKVQAIARKFACSSRCPAVQGRTALTFCWIRSHAKALSVSLSSRLSINQSIYLSIYLSFFLSPRDGGIPKDHCANQIHYKTGSKTPPWRLECKYRRENAVRKKAWREIHSDTEKKKEKKGSESSNRRLS